MHTLRATYDGKVIRPEGTPLNVPFELDYDEPRVVTESPSEWLRTAMEMNLPGPSDMSERFHEHLEETSDR